VTPDTSEEPLALVDSSVAIPALAKRHDFFVVASKAVEESRAGIAAHALFETYSVLTRHPSLRVSPAQALALLDGTFGYRASLSKAAVSRTLQALVRGGIAGGATYDGLVGATAVEAGLPLLTRDLRARRTYEAVGAEVRYLG
jgi:hypothetical protein